MSLSQQSSPLCSTTEEAAFGVKVCQEVLQITTMRPKSLNWDYVGGRPLKAFCQRAPQTNQTLRQTCTLRYLSVVACICHCTWGTSHPWLLKAMGRFGLFLKIPPRRPGLLRIQNSRSSTVSPKERGHVYMIFESASR